MNEHFSNYDTNQCVLLSLLCSPSENENLFRRLFWFQTYFLMAFQEATRKIVIYPKRPPCMDQTLLVNCKVKQAPTLAITQHQTATRDYMCRAVSATRTTCIRIK